MTPPGTQVVFGDSIEVRSYGGNDTTNFTDVRAGTAIGGFGIDTIRFTECQNCGVLPLTPSQAGLPITDGKETIIFEKSQECTAYGGTEGDEFRMAACFECQLYGDYGNDVFTLSGSYTLGTIRGGEDDDVVTVAAGAQPWVTGSLFFGDGGNDNINLQGSDGQHIYIEGGAGSDVLKGGWGRETIRADDNTIGNDIIDGGPNADTIYYDSPGEFMIYVDWNDEYIEMPVVI